MEWYAHPPVGPMVSIFIYSKFFELIDTVFLVLRKRQIIFLHWFHHVTVLLYCWHALHTVTGPGIWFATMNYTVHSVMYFYYFLTNVGFYQQLRPFAPIVTGLQISQMFAGIMILCMSIYYLEFGDLGDPTCHVDRSNYRWGIVMYTAYLILFILFFVEKYLGGSSTSGKQVHAVKKPIIKKKVQ
eukprot:TRINITY_DN4589_c0_g1_i2.p1 TRINITY_DN4589_c0_g1~~TRINITY_DN4589_c0_g1_i2.p1  ORF type:complete len:185 (+),score=4.97 TRINITY_DN4589_c0_g1_i2:135-689(+)